MGDATSAAATRPPARSSATRSTRSMARTCSRSRRRASSSEMVEENGLTAMLLLGLLDHVRQLRHDETLHCQPHGRLGPRERDDDAARRDAGARAAHDRGGPDVLVAEHTEQFARSEEDTSELQ